MVTISTVIPNTAVPATQLVPTNVAGVASIGAGASNWWNAGGCPDNAWADVWTAKTAASYAASKVGNINSTSMTEGNGAVTWDAALGWQFVAAEAKWLDSTIFPNIGYGLIVQFSNIVVVGNAWMCGVDTAQKLYLSPAWNGQRLYGMGGLILVGANTLSGNVAVTGTVAYLNGVSDGVLGGVTALQNKTVYIGALHTSGGPASFFWTGNIQAFGIPKTNIIAYIPALYTAMAAL